MIGSIFSINLLRTRYILALFLLIFAFSVLHLQSLKAPWVDECYSYYGVWHDNFSEFYDSMLTGINFSPPLYFLFNFCIQLVFPTSIDQLRIQSLIFIIIGIILSFLLTRRIFGTTAGFVATILVASQSNLLLSQTQEARHYAMFFACGAWVLYMQSFIDIAVKRYKWITFIAHFCLCQVHYLGIIFSALIGFSSLISRRETPIFRRIPFSIFAVWTLILPIYLFLISRQSSHLGNWPKPNQLSDLLAGYNDSLLILTIIIPLFVFSIINKSDRGTKTGSIKEIQYLGPIIITAVLWLSLPFIFWIISNLSSLNLFVDRYFIPKESALIFLVAYGFSLIFKKLPKIESMSIPILGTFALSVVLVLVNTRRDAFGLNKDTNYHHSLIIEESYPTSKQPIIIEGDPKYFPNAYLNRNEYFLLIKNEDLIKTYNQFSKIKLTGI